MATEEVKEEAVQELPAEPTRMTKIIDAIFIIVLINLAIEVIVTIIAILLTEDYLDQLIKVGTAGVIGFVIIIVVALLTGAGVYELGVKLRGWEENKAVDALMYVTFILGGLLTLILLAGLYAVASAMDPLLDPFGLGNISPVLGLAYSLWWFFGFTISAILLAVLVLMILASS